MLTRYAPFGNIVSEGRYKAMRKKKSDNKVDRADILNLITAILQLMTAIIMLIIAVESG